MLHLEAKHTMEEYLQLLRLTDRISIDHNRLCSAVTDANYSIQDLTNIVTMNLKIHSCGTYRTSSKEDLINFLLDSGVPEKRFTVKNVKSLSFDIDKVVRPLIEDNIFPDILSPYTEMRSYVTYRNFLSKHLLGNQNVVCRVRDDGEIIRQYPFTITERENLRTYYSDIAVVSIPKKYSNIITIPDTDYFLIWCDYPQADWRMAYNLFLRDDTNSKVMDMYEDSYKGAAVLVEGEEFSEDDFKDKRKRYKVDTLKTFFNSRDNNPLVNKLRAFFMNCPKYKKYYNDLLALYKLKIPIECVSYFGFSQFLPEGIHQDAYISKGMNTPIQTMTSHLVIETIFGIIEKFKSLGYTDTQIKPYFVRHDEPVFIAHKSILDNAWVFGDCSTIHIDGFSPIKLDFHFGYNYLEEDNRLTQIVNVNCNENMHRYVQYPKGELNTAWYPIPKVLSGYSDVIIVNDVTYVSFNLEGDDLFEVFTVNDKVYDIALKSAITKLLEKHKDIKYLILDNVNISELYKDNTTLVSLRSNYDNNAVANLKDKLLYYIKQGGVIS